MANNLYDTGAPKRVIVEHQHTVTLRDISDYWEEQVRSVPRDKKKPVVITPEFEEIKERKLLK